ncbi:MAG TPA: flagellar export chaperone FliS [Verrucomicrobiae bacterium]|nr:flagellar export chaperone FliS [Verrucomicrobiae bacterium]
MYPSTYRYAKAYQEASTVTASPGQVILLLYDGILKSLELAKTGFRLEDPAERNMTISNSLNKALNIIRELNRVLDFERGGELAVTLSRLYDYFERQIQKSNITKSPSGIDDVIGQLSEIREAWSQMLQNRGRQIDVSELGDKLCGLRA